MESASGTNASSSSIEPLYIRYVRSWVKYTLQCIISLGVGQIVRCKILEFVFKEQERLAADKTMRKFCARITMITEIYIQYSGHYGSINAFNPRDPGINPIQKQVKASFENATCSYLSSKKSDCSNQIYSFGMF